MLQWKQINKRRGAAWISGSLAFVFAVLISETFREEFAYIFWVFFALTFLFGCVLRLVETGAEEGWGTGFGLILALYLGSGLLWKVRGVVEARVNDTSHERLQKVILAMHEYTHDQAERRLPPPAIYAKDGKPLLSWRVLILPYLGEKALFDRFKLDEPWDSPNNLPLVALMPDVYAPPPGPGMPRETGMTYWQLFVGPGAAFENHQGMRFPKDFPRGSYNTVLIAEATEAVPWSKPADLVYDPNGPLPAMGGPLSGRIPRGAIGGSYPGVLVGLGDGSVRRLALDVPEDLLRQVIDRKNEKPLPEDFWQ